MATSTARNAYLLVTNFSRFAVNHRKNYIAGNEGMRRYWSKSLFSSSISQVSSDQPSPSSDHKTHQEDLLQDTQDPYSEETEPCLLCKANIPISYKNPELLSQFVSPNTGRMYDRQITKLCEVQQQRVEGAIKRARKFGYMPVMYRETYFLKNPDIFDVKYTGSVNIGDHITYPGSYSSGEVPAVPTRKKTDKTKSKRTEKAKVTKSERRKNKNR